MTTQTVIVDFYAGETLGGTLHNETTDALVSTADTTAEITANGAVYAFVFSEVAVISADRYRLKILSAGAVVGTRTLRLTGVDGEIVQSGQPAELDSAARVRLDASQPDYAPAREPALRGGLTLTQAVDLLVASGIGVSSQPSATEERFKFRDAADAFTTTFDVAGNRVSVVLH